MQRKPLSSSVLASAGYENGVLEVEFINGIVYRGEATQAQYDGLISADSPGKYYNALKNQITMSRATDSRQE